MKKNPRNYYVEILSVFPEASGLEYGDMSRLERDYIACGLTPQEYRDKIGVGNLRAYLDGVAYRTRHHITAADCFPSLDAASEAVK